MQLAEAKLEAGGLVDDSRAEEAAIDAGANRDALAAKLSAAREQVENIARDLRTVDAELDDLATTRRQHQLLLSACTTLEELSATGAAELFWGDRAAAQVGAQKISSARDRIEEFRSYVSAIEDRRAALIHGLNAHQQHAGLIEDDLFEALEQEEHRQHEWIVEREINELPARQMVMPWTRGGEEDRRFRKSFGTALLLCLLFALVLPYIPLPKLLAEAQLDVPERVVKLMMKPRPKPPREQTRPQPQQKPVEQKLAKEAQQKPVVPDKQTTEKAEAPTEPVDQGILAFREQFAGLQQDQVVARLGAQARIDSAGDGATRIERKMLTTNAPGSSGGINLGSLSRGIGGGTGAGKNGMAGTQVSRVTSQIGGIGKPGADRPLSGDSVANSRTDEEIQIVFDRYKAALYRLYNRELRKDPTLRGQMVLRLTIEPDGSVSMCQLHASDMNAPELGAQVVERVKSINFGAKDVPAITILYPIDFLPAA
jgi:hypothetical protein